MFHSHPPYVGPSRGMEDHLSDPDVSAFLRTNELFATVIRAPRRSLMAIKTNASPRDLAPAKLNARLREIDSEARELAHGDARKIHRISTKLYCIHFGLSLFIKEAKDEYARKVRLVS